MKQYKIHDSFLAVSQKISDAAFIIIKFVDFQICMYNKGIELKQIMGFYMGECHGKKLYAFGCNCGI